MVVFDTTTLLVALAPPNRAPVVVDGKQIVDARERVDHLIATLDQAKTKIIIPTPALSEALVSMGKSAEAVVRKLDKAAAFKVAPFDTPSALEAALMTQSAKTAGDKRGGATGDWQKVKVDRQIVAIAKVYGAQVIYSNDRDIAVLGPSAGLQVIGIEQLPPPPKPTQPLPPLLQRIEDLKSDENREETNPEDDEED
jgi:predicted nucleic acid-binding protein